jgi:hypothetical protein
MATIRIQLLIATETEWATKNPILRNGEVGTAGIYVSNKLIESRIKVGDGISTWNQLPYATDDIYNYNELATVTIGDVVVGDSLQGERLDAIVNKIVSPYINPQISSFTSANKTQFTYEVGTPLPSNFTLAWAISNLTNIQNQTTGSIGSTDINAFTNLANVNLNILTYILNSASAYKYDTPTNIKINLTGYNNKGVQINTKNINIDWMDYIFWGVNATGEVSTSTHLNAIKAQNKTLSNSLERSYSFSVGYPFILIPEHLSVIGIKFIDNDNGLDFSMNLQSVWDNSLPSTIAYNNGLTAVPFNYKIYRGEFFYGSPTSLTIDF